MTVAGFMSSEEKLNQAIDQVLVQFPVASRLDNLTSFNFLLDQLTEMAPQAHPLESARELYVRLASRETITADALRSTFMMGAAVAISGRSRTAEFNAKAEAEAAEACRQIRENWSSYHQP